MLWRLTNLGSVPSASVWQRKHGTGAPGEAEHSLSLFLRRILVFDDFHVFGDDHEVFRLYVSYSKWLHLKAASHKHDAIISCEELFPVPVFEAANVQREVLGFGPLWLILRQTDRHWPAPRLA